MSKRSPHNATLLTDYDPDSTYSTAYYTLFNNMRFDWKKKQVEAHTALFAMPADYLGRIAAPANVAIAAAQNGVPTILVDADLHSASLPQLFGINAQTGLSDLLIEKEFTTQLVLNHLNKTFIPQLYLLSAGTPIQRAPDISRQLSAGLSQVLTGLRQFLAETERTPGLLVFNSPPVTSGADAAFISSLVDQTFLVIATGHTTRTQAQEAQEQLIRAHTNLAGVVMLDL